jgi:hypothetical protein
MTGTDQDDPQLICAEDDLRDIYFVERESLLPRHEECAECVLERQRSLILDSLHRRPYIPLEHHELCRLRVGDEHLNPRDRDFKKSVSQIIRIWREQGREGGGGVTLERLIELENYLNYKYSAVDTDAPRRLLQPNFRRLMAWLLRQRRCMSFLILASFCTNQYIDLDLDCTMPHFTRTMLDKAAVNRQLLFVPSLVPARQSC